MNAIESVISEYLKDMVTSQEADIRVRVDGLIVPAPWLTNGLTDAKNYLRIAKTSARNNVNWQVVATACEILSKAALKHRLRIHMSPFSSVEKIDYSDYKIVTSESTFWTSEIGYAEAQLTPDQLRSLYEGWEDEAAANRLRIYFFPDGLWNHLSERAQQALVSADKQMVMGTGLSRGAGIFNELRIATEEALHRHLWQPLIVWAKQQQDYLSPRFSGIRRAQERLRDNAPGLDDYENLVLPDVGASQFLRNELHIPEGDARFITQRVCKFLKRLRRARNPTEHGGGYDPAEIRDLYAEALGVGRKGVLPEMLRLLTRRREGRRPDVGGLNL